MFVLHQLQQIPVNWNVLRSEFDNSYPKESFDFNDPNNIPVESVLVYCCGILHESKMFCFTLQFAEYCLDLPVDCELQILLSQLDKLVGFLRQPTEQEVVVDLYEQGCEYKIIFSRSSGLIRVAVDSRERQESVKCQVRETELALSVAQLLLSFIRGVSILVPEMLKEAAFETWFTRLMVNTELPVADLSS
ncbi:MAG: hypothetical protein V4719_25830 [Planctomycetota bacterium]